MRWKDDYEAARLLREAIDTMRDGGTFVETANFYSVQTFGESE